MIDLTEFPELVVQQEVEQLEVFTGIETENRYSVYTPEGELVLHAFEESDFLGRNFMASHRALTIHVVDGDGEPVMSAGRDFFWFMSHLFMSDDEDRPIGALRRQFAALKRRFTLENGDGDVIADVRGSIFRPHTFMVHDDKGEIARITKKWSGLLREGFTDADTFQIRIDSPRIDPDLAMLILGTAFSIDLDFFESSG